MHYDNGSMGKSPRLVRDNFFIWKNRMEAFLMGIDYNLIDIVNEGPHVPMSLIPGTPAIGDMPVVLESRSPKPKANWTKKDRKLVSQNGKPKSTLIMSLPDDIYHSVVNCQTAKEIWDTLVVLFEGTTEVRKNRRSLLIQNMSFLLARQKNRSLRSMSDLIVFSMISDNTRQ